MPRDLAPHPVGGWVVRMADAGTVVIAAGAFWLSATTLADLAMLAGIPAERAWLWPGMVDGLMVIATVAVVVLHPYGRRATAYPWLLLTAGTSVSVLANGYHAFVTTSQLPPLVAAAISAVPPLVLLAVTHLRVQLGRYRTARPSPREQAAAPLESVVVAEPSPATSKPVTAMPVKSVAASRTVQASASVEIAQRLREGGASNRAIARQLHVHPSTVGRWLGPGDAAPAAAAAAREDQLEEAPVREGEPHGPQPSRPLSSPEPPGRPLRESRAQADAGGDRDAAAPSRPVPDEAHE
ncbi:MAG: hypothetical protein BGO94_12900 [Micrococcales bacterium 72-143]|nr:MAG: hypothetical protein BGO94_12900 [Micrococcales bacterium 72-143]